VNLLSILNRGTCSISIWSWDHTYDLIYNREIESLIEYMINQLAIIRKYNHWFLSTNKYKIKYKSNITYWRKEEEVRPQS